MGICFYSPPLDEMGNTVRGVQFCETFVKLYNFQKVKLLLFLIDYILLKKNPIFQRLLENYFVAQILKLIQQETNTNVPVN